VISYCVLLWTIVPENKADDDDGDGDDDDDDKRPKLMDNMLTAFGQYP
jgi:hypothetical protein